MKCNLAFELTVIYTERVRPEMTSDIYKLNVAPR